MSLSCTDSARAVPPRALMNLRTLAGAQVLSRLEAERRHEGGRSVFAQIVVTSRRCSLQNTFDQRYPLFQLLLSPPSDIDMSHLSKGARLLPVEVEEGACERKQL